MTPGPLLFGKGTGLTVRQMTLGTLKQTSTYVVLVGSPMCELLLGVIGK